MVRSYLKIMVQIIVFREHAEPLVELGKVGKWHSEDIDGSIVGL